MLKNKQWQKVLAWQSCALLLMGYFFLKMGSAPVFSQETEPVTYSIVTLQAGESLAELAVKYQTTQDQILLDNPGVDLVPGVTLTIREKTVEDVPAVVLSRGVTSVWIWPAQGSISSKYGWRKGEFHHGVDLAIPQGTAVLAARAGKVTKAQWHKIYGLAVIIDHGNGVESLYAHNQKLLVSPGDWVEQGQKIALSGNTGRSTGPHLHFEIRLNGQAVDPLPYLTGDKS